MQDSLAKDNIGYGCIGQLMGQCTISLDQLRLKQCRVRQFCAGYPTAGYRRVVTSISLSQLRGKFSCVENFQVQLQNLTCSVDLSQSRNLQTDSFVRFTCLGALQGSYRSTPPPPPPLSNPHPPQQLCQLNGCRAGEMKREQFKKGNTINVDIEDMPQLRDKAHFMPPLSLSPSLALSLHLSLSPSLLLLLRNYLLITASCSGNSIELFLSLASLEENLRETWITSRAA